MRKLKPNEKIIKEYEKYILIEVKCPNGAIYKTTIDKWTQKDLSTKTKQTPEELIEGQLDKLVHRR